jgi:hypothetical protein
MSEKCRVNRPCRILDLLGYEYQEPQLLRILLHSDLEQKTGLRNQLAPLRGRHDASRLRLLRSASSQTVSGW